MKAQDVITKRTVPVKLKVCGMGTSENVWEVASLEPDYLGFIFYEGSPRNFKNKIPAISKEIKKIGVFVNASEDFIIEKTLEYGLDAIQLHGGEDSGFCKNLKATLKSNGLENTIEIIKVFSVKEEFDFSVLNEFEESADYFLFDTKGKYKGGNGIPFNWEIMKKYPSSTPFFLSGGIGIEEIGNLQELNIFFQQNGKPDVFYAIDVNSKFETSPGVKDIKMLEKFNAEFKNKGNR